MPDIDQNTDFGGGNILNRFAISALSKKYRNQERIKIYVFR